MAGERKRRGEEMGVSEASAANFEAKYIYDDFFTKESMSRSARIDPSLVNSHVLQFNIRRLMVTKHDLIFCITKSIHLKKCSNRFPFYTF